MRLTLIMLPLLACRLFQEYDRITLKEKAEKAEFIFEGRIIADSTFYSEGNAKIIYTAVSVLVSKEFKGNFTSDTMKLITEGGSLDGLIQTCKDCRPWYSGKGTEGLFFCTHVEQGAYIGISGNSAFWPTIEHVGDGYIAYDCKGKISSNVHHAYCSSDKAHYDDIERELYQPLEQILGTKYRQLRLNCFEQNREK